ncbi:MAG: type VI protein secretion system component VasK [Vicingaceae bacterium]|jgi:type VI protein secretion system component VasK
MKKLLMGVLFCCGICITQLNAQSSNSTPLKNATKVVNPSTQQAKNPVKTTLDTEESLRYLGSQLLFQMKKRLNLTTFEEEKKQSNSSKNKKFSFFGIKVERTS